MAEQPIPQVRQNALADAGGKVVLAESDEAGDHRHEHQPDDEEAAGRRAGRPAGGDGVVDQAAHQQRRRQVKDAAGEDGERDQQHHAAVGPETRQGFTPESAVEDGGARRVVGGRAGRRLTVTVGSRRRLLGGRHVFIIRGSPSRRGHGCAGAKKRSGSAGSQGGSGPCDASGWLGVRATTKAVRVNRILIPVGRTTGAGVGGRKWNPFVESSPVSLPEGRTGEDRRTGRIGLTRTKPPENHLFGPFFQLQGKWGPQIPDGRRKGIPPPP